MSTTLVPQSGNLHLTGEIVGIYKRAVNILVDGALIAFVLPDLGNGPFHIIVNELPRFSLGQILDYFWDGHELKLGVWVFRHTETTYHWEPRPQWEQCNINGEKALLLQTSIGQILKNSPSGDTQALNHAPMILSAQRLDRFWQALLDDDSSAFIDAVRGIVGRGPGLTPTGDDFLAGFMLSLWTLHHPNTRQICNWIVTTAHQRTTTISTAYLKAIEAGYADERWHDLLFALHTQDRQLLYSAISHILSFGATSGSDMLFGFLSGIEFQQNRSDSDSNRNGRKL